MQVNWKSAEENQISVKVTVQGGFPDQIKKESMNSRMS